MRVCVCVCVYVCVRACVRVRGVNPTDMGSRVSLVNPGVAIKTSSSFVYYVLVCE